MIFALANAETGEQALRESVHHPNIRILNLMDYHAGTESPQDDLSLDDQWQQADESTLERFSAVSYFFGRALNQELNVPIGLINVVMVVPAEAWVDAETLRSKPELSESWEHPLQLKSKTYNVLIAPLIPFAIKGAIY